MECNLQLGAQQLKNPTRTHDEAGWIPGLDQQVKDLALLWPWGGLEAAAPIWPLAWEPPCAAGAALNKTKQNKTNPSKCLWIIGLEAEHRLYAFRVALEVKCLYFSIHFHWIHKPRFSNFFTNWNQFLQWMKVTITTQCDKSMRHLRLLFLLPLVMITIAGLDCLHRSPRSQAPKNPYISVEFFLVKQPFNLNGTEKAIL